MDVSVVVATRNSVRTIDETLRSLVPHYKSGIVTEILVVDGYSDDGTLDIVAKYPVMVLLNEKRAFAPARELGWRAARGELIIFLDSDAFLGGGFFPEVFRFFQESAVGLVGCWAKGVRTNAFTRTIAEEWEFAQNQVRPSPSAFFRLYRWLQGPHPQILPGGPCQVVRRACLEAVGGFASFGYAEDLALAEKILEAGWCTRWWLDAPVFHHPRSGLKPLLLQFYRHGQYFALWQVLMNRRSKIHVLVRFSLSVISRLASPLVGLFLALRFRNPRHLVTFPLARYAWLAGYFKVLLVSRHPVYCPRRGGTIDT